MIDQRTGDWHDDQSRDGRTGKERSTAGRAIPDLMQVDEQEWQHQPGSDHGHGVAGEEHEVVRGSRVTWLIGSDPGDWVLPKKSQLMDDWLVLSLNST